MNYHSTRNCGGLVNSAQAVLEGLAPDGGLYMPEYLPTFDWRKCLGGTAMEMASDILSALDLRHAEAMQMALIGGECALKPVPEKSGIRFAVVPRHNMLVFARDADGTMTVPNGFGIFDDKYIWASYVGGYTLTKK